MQNHHGLCEMNGEIRIAMLALCFLLFGLALYEDNPFETNFAVVHFKVPNQSQTMEDDNASLFSLTVTSIMKPNSSYNSNASHIGITDENSGIIVLNHTSSESQQSTNHSTESNFIVNETMPVDENTSSPSIISAELNDTSNQSYLGINYTKIPVDEGTTLPSIISAELNATLFQTNSEINDTNSKISSSNPTSVEPRLPSWTNYSRTQFTDHVLDVIKDLNALGYDKCGEYINFIVSEPYTIPSLVCHYEREGHDVWCITLKRIFATKILPFNVSIGFLLNDKFEPSTYDFSCIGNSSPHGMLTMPNMEDIGAMNYWSSSSNDPEKYREPYKRDIPWENRTRIPIFRGTGWTPTAFSLQDCLSPNFNYSHFLQEPRFHAVYFSHNNPSLLDAKFSRISGLIEDCFSQNLTNGLNKLLPVEFVKPDDYFSQHQVALVLPGIGAAFRINSHFMCGTAVVLQEWEYEEWYTKYLIPHVHYIPLANDLSNLNSTMHWILNHAEEVKQIAANGMKFWETFLTYNQNEEHIYELIYRLSERLQYDPSITQQ